MTMSDFAAYCDLLAGEVGEFAPGGEHSVREATQADIDRLLG